MKDLVSKVSGKLVKVIGQGSNTEARDHSATAMGHHQIFVVISHSHHSKMVKWLREKVRGQEFKVIWRVKDARTLYGFLTEPKKNLKVKLFFIYN